MYQIPYSYGMEIQVIGSGEHGPCRVQRKEETLFRGDYAACERWLRDRGAKPIGGNTAASMAIERGR